MLSASTFPRAVIFLTFHLHLLFNRCFSLPHLEEDVSELDSDAVPGPAAERAKEVLVVCIPVNEKQSFSEKAADTQIQ